MSNYAIRTDLRNATAVDTSFFAKKTDLAYLKSDGDKLDIDKFKNVPSNLSNLKGKVDKLEFGKLETTSIDLSKLSKVVKYDIVKKDVYNAKIKNVEDTIPDINKLGTNTSFNAKINEVKGEILSVTKLLIYYY